MAKQNSRKALWTLRALGHRRLTNMDMAGHGDRSETVALKVQLEAMQSGMAGLRALVVARGTLPEQVLAV
jgi:hypothetical protein